MKAISSEIVTQAKDLAAQAGKLEEIIINRIGYIIDTIFKTFKQKYDCWYFYGAGEGEVGDLWRHYCNNHIDIIIVGCSSEMVIIDKNGDEWGFEDSIPTRWLFEDFEQELIDGKKKFEDKEAERKKKQKELSAAKKQEDKDLVEAAKKKLSKKELAAIRRSL